MRCKLLAGGQHVEVLSHGPVRSDRGGPVGNFMPQLHTGALTSSFGVHFFLFSKHNRPNARLHEPHYAMALPNFDCLQSLALKSPPKENYLETTLLEIVIPILLQEYYLRHQMRHQKQQQQRRSLEHHRWHQQWLLNDA